MPPYLVETELKASMGSFCHILSIMSIDGKSFFAFETQNLYLNCRAIRKKCSNKKYDNNRNDSLVNPLRDYWVGSALCLEKEDKKF